MSCGGHFRQQLYADRRVKKHHGEMYRCLERLQNSVLTKYTSSSASDPTFQSIDKSILESMHCQLTSSKSEGAWEVRCIEYSRGVVVNARHGIVASQAVTPLCHRRSKDERGYANSRIGSVEDPSGRKLRLGHDRDRPVKADVSEFVATGVKCKRHDGGLSGLTEKGKSLPQLMKELRYSSLMKYGSS